MEKNFFVYFGSENTSGIGFEQVIGHVDFLLYEFVRTDLFNISLIRFICNIND